MGRRRAETAARWSACAALAFGLAISCSAGVDGIQLAGLSTGGAGTGGSSGGGASTGGNGGGATGGVDSGGGSPGGGGATGGAGTAGGGTGTGGGGGTPSTGGIGGGGGTPSTGGIGGGGLPGTGGTGSGGATGGAPGTGGASATWPADPVAVTLGTVLSGITAAAWEPVSGRFFLLQPGAHQFWEVDPAARDGQNRAQVVGPRVFASTTSVVTRAFGVNTTSVYAVVDGSLVLLDPATGGTQQTFPLTGTPLTSDLRGAYANQTFFLGNGSATGSAYEYVDGGSITVRSDLQGVGTVVTDGSIFGFRRANGPLDDLHSTAGGALALLSAPCAGGIAGLNSAGLAARGSRIAWVTSDTLELTLHFGSIAGGVCTQTNPIAFGQPTAGPFPVGLIDDYSGLVVPTRAGSTLNVQILSTVRGATLTASAYVGGSGGGAEFVVASGAQPHYAVLIGDVPALIEF